MTSCDDVSLVRGRNFRFENDLILKSSLADETKNVFLFQNTVL